MNLTPDSAVSYKMHRWLLVALAIGLAGMLTELLLIGHHQITPQFIPLAVLALSLLTIGWHLARPSSASLLVLRILMLAMMAAGSAGIVLHYVGNRQAQIELDPSLGGIDLLWLILQAKAPPSLAPGQMALLGLIGLISTLGAGHAPSRQWADTLTRPSSIRSSPRAEVWTSVLAIVAWPYYVGTVLKSFLP